MVVRFKKGHYYKRYYDYKDYYIIFVVDEDSIINCDTMWAKIIYSSNKYDTVPYVSQLFKVYPSDNVTVELSESKALAMVL